MTAGSRTGATLARAARGGAPASTLPLPPQMARPLARAAASGASGGPATAGPAAPAPAPAVRAPDTPTYTTGGPSRRLARAATGETLGATSAGATGGGAGGGGASGGGGGGGGGGSDDQFHDAVLRLLRDEQEQIGQLFPEIF